MIRPLIVDDLDWVLALNNAHAQEVNALERGALAALVEVAERSLVVEGRLAFSIALGEGAPTQGPNHAWFQARYGAFLYVDRIVVAPHARGRGLARQMYEELIRDGGARPLCCEVNLLPPNPASLAFHQRLGFQDCGEALDPRNGKRVRYLMRAAARL
jgi:predicted GNAT superfamily acetyltransferase